MSGLDVGEKPLTIAITGMNAKPDNPGPGLAVARCLRDSPDFSGRIIGLGYDALDPGLYLDTICDASYLLPFPSAGEEAWMSRLDVVHGQERIDLLIPCLDAELLTAIRLEEQLMERGIKTFLPNSDQFRMCNKDRLTELAEIAGIDSPESINVTDVGFFNRCVREGWNYPLVVKGLFYDAKVVTNPYDASLAFRHIAAEWGLPVVVQKLVEGNEVNLTAVGDGNGNLLAPVMMTKRAITDKGKAWAGMSIDDPKLQKASEEIVKTLKWRGPLEVEIMRGTDETYNLIEINPRFPAWIYLSAGVDRNLPATLVKLAMGEPLPEMQSVKAGVLFIRHALETIVPLDAFESIVISGGWSPKVANEQRGES
ncbi:MAG: ATP-grasp domain-containing protein [Magnetococcales bacterium]|nr:ATP-grasp domain-containing protein [Magnetococcales bacterium]